MKFNSFAGGAAATLITVASAFFIYNKVYQPTSDIRTETITEIKVDTVYHYVDQPIPRDSIVLRYVSVKAPIKPSRNDSVQTVADSATVTLPITQKVYQDSTYKAWVSGYLPALDSIRIYQPVTTITNTVTHKETVYKNKRWGIGIQAGVGMAPNRIEPYIGIGVSYNIFSW